MQTCSHRISLPAMATDEGCVHDTVLNACSAEFAPLFSGQPDVVACGAYQLDEGKRLGRIEMLRTSWSPASLESLQKNDMNGGVLDLKWSGVPLGDHAVIGAAMSSGSLELLSLGPNGVLSPLCASAPPEPSHLLLSLDWANRLGRPDDRVVATTSTGAVTVFRTLPSGIEEEESWPAHSFECWIAAFSAESSDVIFSGGDDCTMFAWDLRSGTSSPVATNRRTHKMGVTTMQSSPHRPHILVTGSYDEHVRQWDIRSLARPLTETRLPGGGVWRVKHRPDRDGEILAAAMHSGAFYLKQDEAGEMSIARHYDKHTSLGYGADWHPSGNGLIATCSFYDHALHLWHI